MRRTALLSTLLAACGGGGTDVQPTLVLAERSDSEIALLLQAAVGTDAFLTQAAIDDLGSGRGDPCPALTIEGNVATLTGGCTMADGRMIEGSAVVTNPIGWDGIEDYDFGRPTLYEARSLTVTFSGQPPRSFDGFVRRSSSFTVLDADVTVTHFGVPVRSDIYSVCSNPSAPSCTIGGSGVELVGVGGALVSATIRIDLETGQQTTDVVLQGVDRLTMRSTGVCTAWSIEGTDRGTTCP